MIKRFFKKISKVLNSSKDFTKNHNEYNEKDTKCDLCNHECKKDCYLIDITTRDDTRRHFINGIGFDCPLIRKANNND